MPLKPPIPGLRRIHYDGVSPGKAAIIVQPDDVLDVSDAVAEQLLAASAQFKDASATPAPPPDDDEHDDDREPAGEQQPSPAKKAPAKKSAARKKTAAKSS